MLISLLEQKQLPTEAGGSQTVPHGIDEIFDFGLDGTVREPDAGPATYESGRTELERLIWAAQAAWQELVSSTPYYVGGRLENRFYSDEPPVEVNGHELLAPATPKGVVAALATTPMVSLIKVKPQRELFVLPSTEALIAMQRVVAGTEGVLADRHTMSTVSDVRKKLVALGRRAVLKPVSCNVLRCTVPDEIVKGIDERRLTTEGAIRIPESMAAIVLEAAFIEIDRQNETRDPAALMSLFGLVCWIQTHYDPDSTRALVG